MDSQHNKASNMTDGKVQSDNSTEAYGLIANTHIQVLCCCGTACYGSGSLKIIDNFIRVIAEYGLGSRVDVVATGCFGFCAKGPIVRIMPDNTTYVQVSYISFLHQTTTYTIYLSHLQIFEAYTIYMKWSK